MPDASPTALWLRRIALPIALHFALCLGLFQYGLTNAEMARLHIDGPSHLIDAYVKAVHVFGPLGVIRTYLRGEADERLYLEYTRLLLEGTADMKYIADRQNDPSVNVPLPPRAWPYRDVRVEYPPLAFLGTLPPGLLSLEYVAYRRAFITYMLLLNFANLWLALSLVESAFGRTRTHDERSKLAMRALYASLLFCLALGVVVITRMDHIAVTATLLCLVAFDRAQRSEAGARLRWAAACGGMAAAGVMTKIVPGLAGLVAVTLWLSSDAPDRFRCVLACIVAGAFTLIGLNVVMFAFAGDNYLATYRYHTLRGVQLESLYSGVLLLLRPFGLAMQVDESFGSTNLASRATGLVKQLSPVLFVLSAGLVLLRRRFTPNGLGALALTSILLLLFMLTNRVFSPQYLIWIGAPVCVLAARDPARRRTWLVFLSAVVLSQLIFPRGYPMLKAFHPLAVAALDLRNLLLVLFTVLLTRAYSRRAGQAQ